MVFIFGHEKMVVCHGQMQSIANKAISVCFIFANKKVPIQDTDCF